jgi:hypothetical protein
MLFFGRKKSDENNERIPSKDVAKDVRDFRDKVFVMPRLSERKYSWLFLQIYLLHIHVSLRKYWIMA